MRGKNPLSCPTLYIHTYTKHRSSQGKKKYSKGLKMHTLIERNKLLLLSLLLLSLEFLQCLGESDTRCLAEIDQIITALAQRLEGCRACVFCCCGILSAWFKCHDAFWVGVGEGRRYLNFVTYPKSGCEDAFSFPKDGESYSRRTRRRDCFFKNRKDRNQIFGAGGFLEGGELALTSS